MWLERIIKNCSFSDVTFYLRSGMVNPNSVNVIGKSGWTFFTA